MYRLQINNLEKFLHPAVGKPQKPQKAGQLNSSLLNRVVISIAVVTITKIFDWL